jgi:hypothetical protein
MNATSNGRGTTFELDFPVISISQECQLKEEVAVT